MPWVTPPGLPEDTIIVADRRGRALGRAVSRATHERYRRIFFTPEQIASIDAARAEWGNLARAWVQASASMP